MLGIEGSGTKPVGAPFRSRRRIKNGVMPAANLRLTSSDALAQMFQTLPREATRVGVFLAGCANQADCHDLRGLVQHAWPNASVRVGSDRDSGFATAFRDGDGITVNAGTGSAVTGRRGQKVEKAGGWGQLLGDKGGGYNLAVQALRLVLSDYDGIITSMSSDKASCASSASIVWKGSSVGR